METSRLTSKHQATVPADVRTALGLRAGDTIAWDVIDGEARVRKARPIDMAFAGAISATLTEWASDEDEEAWRDL